MVTQITLFQYFCFFLQIWFYSILVSAYATRCVFINRNKEEEETP